MCLEDLPKEKKTAFIVILSGKETHNSYLLKMPSIAEWDSIYNKTLEMISVRNRHLLSNWSRDVKGALDPHSGTKDVIISDLS